MGTRAETPRGQLIDLTPDETGILSFVAANANIPSVKSQLETILASSTDNARAIGAVILGDRDPKKAVYKFMAKRFTDASANNATNTRILNSSNNNSSSF